MKGSVAIHERNLSTWVARLTDAVVIVIAHVIATYFRADVTMAQSLTSVATLLAVAIFSIIADANGLYSSTLRSAPRRVEVGKVWLSWGVTPPILLTLAFATKLTEDYSRVVTLAWFLITPVLITLWR